MEKEIVTGIDETTADLLQTIALFTPAQFSKIPFEGSWSAAQVAEHIYKSESGFPYVWKGESKTTERAVDEKVPVIKGIFLDFTTKMKSPDFILPSDNPPGKEALYNTIKANREEVAALASTIDLNKIFAFPFPQLGELTGIEWATFLICHSQRHILQMKKIYEIVK